MLTRPWIAALVVPGLVLTQASMPTRCMTAGLALCRGESACEMVIVRYTAECASAGASTYDMLESMCFAAPGPESCVALGSSPCAGPAAAPSSSGCPEPCSGNEQDDEPCSEPCDEPGNEPGREPCDGPCDGTADRDEPCDDEVPPCRVVCIVLSRAVTPIIAQPRPAPDHHKLIFSTIVAHVPRFDGILGAPPRGLAPSRASPTRHRLTELCVWRH